jgi:hypothetical protein
MTHVSKRKRLLAIAAGSVVTLGTVGAVAIADKGSTPAPTPPSYSAASAPSSVVANEIGVFKRASTSGDRVPQQYEELHWRGEERFGANGYLSRRARLSPSGKPVYLIPGRESICMLNSSGTENFCAPQQAIAAGNANAISLCAPRSLSTNDIEIAGILPDGVQTAVTVLSNGEQSPLNVEGNVYVADFARTGPLPETIQWTDAEGKQHSASTHLPSGVATEDCEAPPK